MQATFLAPRQLATLRFIDRYYRANGIPPTLREIREVLGCRSIATVHAWVGRLIDGGLVVRKALGTRGVMVTAQGQQVLQEAGDDVG